MFVNLHTHSYYSFLSGVPSPRQLVEQAVRYRMPALALTDSGWMTGSIEFFDACQELGVQPILGLEVPVCLPGRPENLAGNLVLLAMDMKGWGNLCRVSSELHCSPACVSGQALSFEQLTWDTQGLICLTGGQNGLGAYLMREYGPQDIKRYLGLLHEVFSNRLYLELYNRQPAGDAQLSALLQMAGRLRIPPAAASPVYYLNSQQAHLQQVLAGIRLIKPMRELEPGELAPPDSYFYPPEVMQERFVNYPQALENTLEIAARCRFNLPLGELHYPRVEGQPGSSLKTLRKKAFAGAKNRLGEMNDTIRERLDYELSVIEKSGYTSLFLIMEEIIQYTRKADIPYSSRGSAGSSLVAFSLGITIPDPLRLNLYFERFLNPARHSPPDIDTDLDSNRRDKVIQHVYEKYGSESVAMVATINRFRSRSALREVAKTYGLSQSEIKRISSALPRRWGPPHRDKSADADSPFDVLAEQFPQEEFKRIFADARALLDFPHHLSVHPGGVVIAPGKMTDLAAVAPANKGVLITQYDLEMVERIGLVKIDLLGTRGLSVLGDVADAARQRLEESPRRLEFIENIPDEDEETSECILNGRTVGCFAIESPGMQRTLRETHSRSIDDIMIALALYRPGPMSGGLKDAFVRRHLGLEKTTDLHPALRVLLAETYGVILYQEQVLKVAHELAGFSLADADLLRRAMSHFDPGERMRTLQRKFISGALERHGVPPQTGERIWEMMAAFAGYGFPKAHSASYARVAWRSAYCKVHYPAEFLAAVLANWGGYYRQDVYLLEARRLGLQVKGPDVNHSLAQFSVVWQGDKPVLFMGLGQVRDLTRQSIRRIIQNRPFNSLSDFMLRVQPRPKEMEYLVQVGALDKWGSIPALLRQAKRRQRRSGQLSLFGEEPEVYENTQDWSSQERAAVQKKLLGASLVAHPLELLARPIERLGAMPIREAGVKQGQTVRAAGICQRWRKGVRSGQVIYHTVLDDLTAGVMLVAAEAEYKRFSAFLNSKVPLVVEGRIEKSRETGEPVLFLKRVFDPEVE